MKGVLAGLLLVGLVLSCARGPFPPGEGDRIAKMNEVTALWTQIRQFRAEMNLPLEPSSSMLVEFKNKSVKDAQRVCAAIASAASRSATAPSTSPSHSRSSPR